MSDDLEKAVPVEMASAVNLLMHPVAGAAAMSAFGIGLASHAIGMWMGAMAGAIEASQRLLETGEPAGRDEDAGPARKAPSSKASATTRKLIAEAQSFARDVAEPVGAGAGPAVARARPQGGGIMPEDFRRPRALERPARPDDLKAIPGIGPKLEQVLNGLGIWTYAQIAGWTREEIAWVDDYLGFKGRIERDGWIAQAAGLARDGTGN